LSYYLYAVYVYTNKDNIFLKHGFIKVYKIYVVLDPLIINEFYKLKLLEFWINKLLNENGGQIYIINYHAAYQRIWTSLDYIIDCTE